MPLCIELARRNGNSTGIVHPFKRAVELRTKYDNAVAVPGPANAARCVRKRDRRPACQFDAFEFAARKKSDAAAVRRPERIRRVLSCRQVLDFGGIKSANQQL